MLSGQENVYQQKLNGSGQLGGLKNKTYPWGNISVNVGQPKMQLLTGNFPTNNTKKDGFIGIAPVMQFPPNGYGLYDVAGNVWEICSDWCMEKIITILSI